MENLYYNLSDEEFSKGRKLLLWIFAGIFFLAGVFVLLKSLVFGQISIPPILSLAPFGISLLVTVIASLATIKRKDLFFSIDDEKIEFRYGILNPRFKSFRWIDINEIIMPHKQKKAMILFKNGTYFVINLTWLQRRKASKIRKHIYLAAKSKNLNVTKVTNLVKKS